MTPPRLGRRAAGLFALVLTLGAVTAARAQTRSINRILVHGQTMYGMRRRRYCATAAIEAGDF